MGAVRWTTLEKTNGQEEIAADDVTIFEISRDIRAILHPKCIPNILSLSDLAYSIPSGSPMQVLGYPSNQKCVQLQYDPEFITPHLLSFKGIYGGPAEMPNMGRMDFKTELGELSCEIDDLVTKVTPYQDLQGLCGSPVFVESKENLKICGMVTMAGTDRIHYINIDVVHNAIQRWATISSPIPP